MERSNPPGKVRTAGLALYLALLALLVAVNAAAVAGIFAARDEARREALAELELETAVHARGLEADLAGLRGDLGFLSQSAPLARALPEPARDDPMARRWRRLDLEGTLLLFLSAHPAVERLTLLGPDGRPRAIAGRSSGVPVVLPATEVGNGAGAAAPPSAASPTAADAGLLVGRWAIGAAGVTSDGGGVPPEPGDIPPESGGGGSGGTLEAVVVLDELVRAAAPGLEGRLSLVPPEEAGTGPATDAAAGFSARVPVRDEGWQPPLDAVLVRRESASRLVQTVEALAGRYRSTVLLNVAVIGLSVTLGFLAFRQARRAERLAAAAAHQARLRELERQLLHSERLASVGRLAAGMAHEINNPLEGMANYLSLLDDELAAGDLEAARGVAVRVRDGLDRAAGILRRVLSASASGREGREPLDLRAVVADAVGFVRGTGSFPAVAVALREPAGPLPVLGSRVTLGQLFLNLLLNACQAQPAGGEVEVTVGRDGDRARVVVADRGPGIPAEVRGRLFEPFFSTRGSTGLGLSVCHGIAADHGGEIAARDRPGGGTEMEVRLPLARTAGASADRDSPTAAATARKPADREAVTR